MGHTRNQTAGLCTPFLQSWPNSPASSGASRAALHMFELLGPLATVAYQTRVRSTNQRDPNKKPGHLDTCHALATDGPVVKENYPEFYTGD